ncbi:hypothetical protein B0J12DRAFT_356958 [Macrophomina phaseolina]|uniref:AT hook domain-containing protein n=1 Tax=Macrophomina phaseolina TaxID=35725 RepID=A0ABQ8FWW3_9PEZI|nr:hypothetical protein B0J12DRAFT_356958 [Macrophomina phaseolina]
MVRNIVEDSDDEGDFGALSPVSSRPVSPTPPDASVHVATRTQKSAPGTSSTEELRRDIAAAHKDVIDKSAAPNGSGCWSSPIASRKRRTTLSSLEGNPAPPAKRQERDKTPKAYGDSDRGNHSLFKDNETLNAVGEGAVRGSGYSSTGTQIHETSETWFLIGHEQAAHPEMHPSLHEDFALHDPAVMFPTTMSSTVPDATTSQQHLVEAAQAEYSNQFRGHGVAAKIMENPCVSWSDRLESTEREMRSSQSGPEKSQQQSQENTERSLPCSSKQAPKERLQPPAQDRSASPASVGSNKPLRRPKTTPYPRLSQSSHDELGDQISQTEPASSFQRPVQSVEGMSVTQKLIDESVKESIRAVRASKAAKARVHESSDALNSDDLAIGLPKERYIPRPTRSRSARSTVEEPDYSVTPEKAARSRKKCQKTVESMPEYANEVEAVADGDSGSQNLHESQTKRPAQESGRSPADPIDDTLLTGKTAPVESTQKNTPNKAKRKRGRPPKNTPETARVQADVQHDAHLGEVDELQQVMPLDGSSHDVGTRVPHEEQLLHDPDFEDTSRPRLPSPFVQPTPTSSARQMVTDKNETQQVDPKLKKKGRGRPRSRQKIEISATDVDKPQAKADDLPQDEGEKCQESQENTSLKGERSNDEQKGERGGKEADGGVASEAAGALGRSGSPEQPSEKHEVDMGTARQQAAVGRESAQPSPLGKGKVPVRVGLSRRARIAPLLKIVKK